MTLLAIETSCDETSVAVVRRGRVLSNIVSSQMQMHAEYGGVVPELAAREHVRNFLPVAREALRKAGVGVVDLEGVAATQGPGLPGALLVGLRAGQALAWSLQIPFVNIHHHEAHLYSPWIGGDDEAEAFSGMRPHVSLIVSGGHTLLVAVEDETRFGVLGSTVDDAAGECFDKVAKLLGLAYPGGPEIDRLAAEGNPRAYAFPRPMMHDGGDDFSFSGLKTSLRYFVRDRPELLESREAVCDLCASVQAAIVEVLTIKAVRAAVRLGVDCMTASGGVTCNRGLRASLAEACRARSWELRLADRAYCTDNAAMIGVLAERKLSRGESGADWGGDIRPGWGLPRNEGSP